MRVVITGMGALCSAGAGKEAFWASLFSGQRAPERISRFKAELSGYEVSGMDLDKAVDDRRFRRASMMTKFALVSAKEALKDSGLTGSAGCLDGLATGVISGVTHGSLGLSCEYHRMIVLEGGASASPALFSDSVLNASTGSISLMFSARGPAHTLIGGAAVGLQAISLGADLIKSGAARLCIVSCAEVMEEISVDAYLKLSRLKSAGSTGAGFIPGEGAGAVILESLDDAVKRGIRPVAEVAGSGFVTADLTGRPATSAAVKAMGSLKMDPREISMVISGQTPGSATSTLAADLGIVAPELLLNTRIGECFAASSMLGVVAGAMSLSEGRFPASLSHAYDNLSNSRSSVMMSTETLVDNCLVTASGPSNESGALVLKKV